MATAVDKRMYGRCTRTGPHRKSSEGRKQTFYPVWRPERNLNTEQRDEDIKKEMQC